jgi:DNA-binding IclR family transcriptional regulator
MFLSRRYCNEASGGPTCVVGFSLPDTLRAMPARFHRTVDRVVDILEKAAASHDGISLAELATSMNAAKSSIQQLTNGLVARGYLIEENRRLFIGPGPFVLASRANKSAAMSLDHRLIVEVAKQLDCIVLVGIRVGDSLIHVDHVGQAPVLEYVSRTYARRSLFRSAAGKVLLANLPEPEMNRLTDLTGPEEVDAVQAFLLEVPEIRTSDLAFNRGVTLENLHVTATPLRDGRGDVIAAVSAAVDAAEADRLDELAVRLRTAVSSLLPDSGAERAD